MNWDQFEDVGPTPQRGEEQLCPEGTHSATIGWVKLQGKEWAKKPANPDGMCLTVRLDFGKGIKAVFDSIPCVERGRVESLCRSARVDPPRGDWDEGDLVGQVVIVETVLAVSKQGNDYVKVASYKPQQEPIPKAIRDLPARTPTQKADAATAAAHDDIPFLWVLPLLAAAASHLT